MVNIGDELHGLPPNTRMIPGPRVQRQVLLRPGGKESAPLVYACSWWNATDVDTYLADKSKPIWVRAWVVGAAGHGNGLACSPPVCACSRGWRATMGGATHAHAHTHARTPSLSPQVSLSQEHVELYREVQLVYHGHSASLERLLQCEGPFWGRSYIFWHNARPLTLIYEVFSNRLLEQLGPASPPPPPPPMQR
jgi:chorismate--pyruvate lyase